MFTIKNSSFDMKMAYHHAINLSLRSKFYWLISSNNKHFLRKVGHKKYSTVLNLKHHYSTSNINNEVPYTFNLTTHYKNPQNLVKIPYTKPNKLTGISQENTIPNGKLEGYFSNYDIIIIGGGVMGCSAAFWLGQHGLKILVVERDPTVCVQTLFIQNFQF